MADAARQAGVLGQPVSHSLSPVLHNAAYAALGLDWAYSAIECSPAQLPEVLATRASWAGFSLTMPLKRAGLDIAASVTPRAQQVGAANTLLPTAQGWQADNTDVAGVLGALEGVAPAHVTVLGAGGTAQAVVVALGELGVGECTVLVRDLARGEELLGTARRAGVGLTLAHLDVSSPALAADLVVSTVPAGAADALAGAAWHAGQTLLDVVYAPWPTPLAAAVSAAGGQVRSGALMLLHQAMVQVELMTGLPAPAAAMRSALAAAAPKSGL